MIFLTSLLLILNQLIPIDSPTDVRAYDSPNDAGGMITVEWKLSRHDSVLSGYEISRAHYPDTEFVMIGYVGSQVETLTDDREIEDGVKYWYRVRARTPDFQHSAFSEPSNTAIASAQWFHRGKTNVLVAATLFTALLLYFVRTARKGRRLFVRRIAGLDALDEAVGRATEMGRPVLFVPGLSTMTDVATIASMNILGQVAKKTAQYDTPIIVPNCDPIVMTVAQEMVKEAHLSVGRPDSYKEDRIFYLTRSQFAYAAGVDGIMMRERPATNLFIGMFYAESLILAETGNMTGAVQIAATDAVTQLPFFVTACDYTIMGEELYAASAYLSKEPLLLGGLKAQDWAKVIILVSLFTGMISYLFGFNVIANLFNIP